MRITLALLMLLVLPACGALTAVGDATRALDAYEIRSTGDLPRAAGGPVSRDLIVELPSTGGALDTDRILIRPTPLEARYLAESRWTDPVPTMVQTLLVRGLQQTGAVRFVGRRPIGVGGDFALLVEITDFQAEIAPETGAVTTRIRLVGTMVRESDARVIASRTFEVTAPSSSTDVRDVVAAMDGAMARLMPDFVRWALGAVGAPVS